MTKSQTIDTLKDKAEKIFDFVRQKVPLPDEEVAKITRPISSEYQR